MQLRRFSALCALGFAATLAVACGGDAPTRISRDWWVDVKGTVLDGAGKPLAVPVLVFGLYVDNSNAVKVGRCSGLTSLSLSTRADSAGRFSVQLYGSGAPSLMCLLFQASIPTKDGIVTSTIEADSVLIGPTMAPMDVVLIVK